VEINQGKNPKVNLNYAVLHSIPKEVAMGMNRNLVYALILGISGVIILGYSASQGESNAGIFLFIPVFYGSGLFAFLGVLCIMGAMILGFVGFAERNLSREDHDPQPTGTSKPTTSRPQKSIKGGGVVLIGPIPIIFGSDPKTTVVLVVFALIIMVAAIIMIYLSLL
jgi:uncharacterized protein (TIGR00304 family)